MASIDTGTDQLLFAIADGVATITLNRPEARNALSDTLTPALRLALASIPDRADVGAVIITGAGTAFCAGGDVKSMGSGKTAKLRSLDEAAADLRHRAIVKSCVWADHAAARSWRSPSTNLTPRMISARWFDPSSFLHFL